MKRILLMGLLCAAVARADAVEPADSAWLATQAARLAAPEAGSRAEVVHTLSHLDVHARDGVVARLSHLAPARPPSEEVVRVLAALRAESDDSLRAVPALLERERKAAVAAAVEPLLYLRSLERMAGAEGHFALAAFADLDGGAWESELQLAFDRLGMQLVPALLRFRNHESARLRSLAAAQLSALGMEEPKLVLASTDPHFLARAIRAYTQPLDFAAMPGIARLLGDRHIQVRDAARAAIARFGKNAIWQLREVYAGVVGQPADKRWDHQRTARELYAVLDRARHEEADTWFERGQRALERGDVAAMRREYDALLARYPSFEGRAKLAPGYAALAASSFHADELEAAVAAYQRAVRLAPNAPGARRWQAEVAFVSAELALTRGIVDLPGYTRAIRLDPSHSRARDAFERLSGTRSQHARDIQRRWALAALAGLSLLAAYLLWRMRSSANNFEFGSREAQSPREEELSCPNASANNPSS